MEHKNVKRDEPTVAPSVTYDFLGKKATKQEIKQGDFTAVTRFHTDRTPDDD